MPEVEQGSLAKVWHTAASQGLLPARRSLSSALSCPPWGTGRDMVRRALPAPIAELLPRPVVWNGLPAANPGSATVRYPQGCVRGRAGGFVTCVWLPVANKSSGQKKRGRDFNRQTRKGSEGASWAWRPQLPTTPVARWRRAPKTRSRKGPRHGPGPALPMVEWGDPS